MKKMERFCESWDSNYISYKVVVKVMFTLYKMITCLLPKICIPWVESDWNLKQIQAISPSVLKSLHFKKKICVILISIKIMIISNVIHLLKSKQKSADVLLIMITIFIKLRIVQLCLKWMDFSSFFLFVNMMS